MRLQATKPILHKEDILGFPCRAARATYTKHNSNSCGAIDCECYTVIVSLFDVFVLFCICVEMRGQICKQ